MKVLKTLAILPLSILALVSITYTLTKTLDPSGAIDFHSYWYAGHFIRQGKEPYQAYFEKDEPDVPVTYWDRKGPQDQPVAQPGLATTPANTAPVVLLLSIFSFVSWPTAKVLWMAANLIWMILIPWLVIRYLPDDLPVGNIDKLLIFLAFLSLFGTRNIAGNGQTSFLIFGLMLLTLLIAERSWPSAGIALGIALSKYSLSIPVFLLMCLKRKYKIAGLALLVQLLAVFVLAWLTRASPIQILGEYFRMIGLHANLPGIHLASVFPENLPAAVIMVLVLTVIVFGSVAYTWRRSSKENRPHSHAWEYHLTTIFVLWSLLAAYHRAYDTFVAILFIALVIAGLEREKFWNLTPLERGSLGLLLALTMIVMVLPARGILFIKGLQDSVLAAWLDFQGKGMTLILVAILFSTLWLLPKQRGLTQGVVKFPAGSGKYSIGSGDQQDRPIL